MPKYTKEVAELKARNLTKSYISSGLNQSEVARREGVTSSAINQRLKHLPVQTPLQEALNKIGITTRYKAKKFKELLEAKKLQGEALVETEDNAARVATLKLICQVGKDIDGDKNDTGVRVINIIHAYRRDKNASSDA